jgi:putative thioredoxin
MLVKLKAENPKDAPTSALLAQVNLMKRTMDCDHEAILAAQPTTFDEAIVLADVLLAIGDFASSFEIMLSLYTQVSPVNKTIIKDRMLEYFEIGGPNNESVKSARARLATLLY